MAKKELEEQLKSYEGYINDIPLVIDPCKQCKKQKRKSDIVLGYSEECHKCCWFYNSKFEVKVE